MTAAPPVRLTEWTTCGGCAAKWGGAHLAPVVQELASAGSGDERLLLGLAPFDDAAIYRLGPDLALVSTTDFFPPLVDDPTDFGAIAAANACSDVWAMGGDVKLALNVAAFPEGFPTEAVVAILTGAAEAVGAAGGTVAGGHTIRSPEPIFGLAVQGLVHPDRVWRKSGARPGDHLVLSKPVGTGLVLADASADRTEVTAGMRRLNRAAADDLRGLGADVHAVTDVTGYGLAGHAWEMADRSGVTAVVDTTAVPVYGAALDAAARGVRTGGDARNRAYVEGHVASRAPAELEALCLDPQTSGGLLAAVAPEASPRLVAAGWAVVGDVQPGPPAIRLC